MRSVRFEQSSFVKKTAFYYFLVHTTNTIIYMLVYYDTCDRFVGKGFVGNYYPSERQLDNLVIIFFQNLINIIVASLSILWLSNKKQNRTIVSL